MYSLIYPLLGPSWFKIFQNDLFIVSMFLVSLCCNFSLFSSLTQPPRASTTILILISLYTYILYVSSFSFYNLLFFLSIYNLDLSLSIHIYIIYIPSSFSFSNLLFFLFIFNLDLSLSLYIFIYYMYPLIFLFF